MRFSKEDIEEIKKKLELLYPPKNDWQLGKCVLPVKGEEEVVIMQGGRNVRCNLKDMYKVVSMREFGSFVNMDEYAGLPVTNLEDAISYVDPVFRRRGMVLTFQTQEVYEDPDNLNVSRPVWETWQFTGEVSQWGDTDKWAKMWSQDVNNVRITGAKVEGRELFIRVGSTWVRTDIDFDAISGSLSQEDADRLVSRISELEARVEELETNGGGGQSHDIVLFEGELSYSGQVPASGGSPSMTNTLKLTVNGSEQDVEITYSVDQLYASVNQSTGQVTFAPATSQSPRTVVVTATCVYGGRSYTKTASAVQEALAPEVITLSGSLSYSGTVPAAGGSISPSNTLSLTKNGVAQNVVFSFSSDQEYAVVDQSTGSVVFAASQSSSQRTATVTATCVYGGVTYSRSAEVRQEAYVPDTVELSGSLSYSGTVPAAGGSVNPVSTLRLLKNGVEQQVTFAFTSNQSYANVGSSTGVVTFTASQSTSQRTATITASCTFEGQTYTKTATVTQAAYVAPVETEYIYAGGHTSWDPTMSVSDFTEIKHVDASSKTISFTVTGYNIIGVLCPTGLTLTLAKHLGEVEEDLTQEMLSSVSNVSYNGKNYKMYQFKFLAGILSGENFTMNFN